MDNLSREQKQLREQLTGAFGPKAFAAMEQQVRANMGLFTEAMRMFSPFSARNPEKPGEAAPEAANPQSAAELDGLKRQMAEMQARLEALSRK
jgi:polyhydroxyalkanoate synthesis regulator protein